MAKVVLTGGAGFIGSHIAEELLSRGHSVTIIDDLSSGCRENVPAGCGLEVMDIRSPEARTFLSKLEPEYVVHAAAQMSVRLSMEDPAFDTHVNVYGLINLLQAFHGRKQPFFVLLSTGGAIYGEQETFPAAENHPIVPASVYGLAKYVSELYLDLWRRQFGLRYAALRLANVYGPRQNPHGEAGVVAIFCQKLFLGETPLINGSGEQTRDFVYVKDVAAAVGSVVAESVEGTFNIGTAVETSVNRLYEAISAACEVNIQAAKGPAKAGEQMRSCIDYGRAKAAFGWSPRTGLSKGIELTAEFFRRQAKEK
ncbi:MAG: NAD-dependent epimerase/dehydratase family protein [Deltaproteobacteria bacterium]|nr:NAD-dependent epimerase/dehydratase family protein [Deltaproteobacteria bacterium]